MNIYNIVAIILGIIGLIWLIYALWRNSRVNQIRSWPKTSATVVNVFAVPANSAAGNRYVDPQSIVVANNKARFTPHVLYTYIVKGKEYQSTNVIYSGANSYSATEIKTILGQITPGETIQVYYNPGKPTQSYIYNGSNNYTGVVIGILLLLLAGYLWYHQYKKSGNPMFAMKGNQTRKINTTVSDVMNPKSIEIASYRRRMF